MTRIRVVAVDDHPIVLDGIRRLLSSEPDLELVGTATSGGAGIRLIAERAPDVAVIDLRLGGRSAPDVCRTLQAASPSVRTLIFTAFDEPEAIAVCRRYGARGVVAKDSGDLASAIRNVARGRTWPPAAPATPRGSDLLTHRETDVLLVLSQGLTSRQIADTLGLSYNTVRGYVQSVIRKLEASNRVEALAVARRRGLI